MNITWVISSIMIHQIFLLAHDWSKRFTLTNITYLKLGDIQGYHPSDTPQFSNLAINLRLKFNQAERASFVCNRSTDEREIFVFRKVVPENTQKEHPTQKKTIFHFQFPISYSHSQFPVSHSPFYLSIPHSQSHSPVPFPTPHFRF